MRGRQSEKDEVGKVGEAGAMKMDQVKPPTVLI